MEDIVVGETYLYRDNGMTVRGRKLVLLIKVTGIREEQGSNGILYDFDIVKESCRHYYGPRFMKGSYFHRELKHVTEKTLLAELL